jgi:hypothetical protein
VHRLAKSGLMSRSKVGAEESSPRTRVVNQGSAKESSVTKTSRKAIQRRLKAILGRSFPTRWLLVMPIND